MPAERDAWAASVVRARAQAEAGETVDGEAVYEWLESWGTANELPPPKPSLAERLCAIADELAMLAKEGGADMTKDEIAAMWSPATLQEEE